MTARECTRALSDIRSQRDPGLRSWLMGAVDAAHVELIVAFMRAAGLWASLRRRAGALAGGGGGKAAAKGGEQKGEAAEEEEEEGGLKPLGKLPAEFVAATTGAQAS